MRDNSWKNNNCLREANESKLNALADRLEALADEIRDLASEGDTVTPKELDKKVSNIVTDYAFDSAEFLKKGAQNLLGDDSSETNPESFSWTKDTGDSIRKGGTEFQTVGVSKDTPEAEPEKEYDGSPEETAVEYEKLQNDFVEPAVDESKNLSEACRAYLKRKALREAYSRKAF